MRIEVTLEGEKEVLKNLRRLAVRYPEAAADALYAEGMLIDANMVPRIPVDTGRLRASHYVAPPKRDGGVLVVEVGVGMKYAVPVHERTELRHTVGEAKYLENALNALSPGMGARLAKRIKDAVEGGKKK